MRATKRGTMHAQSQDKDWCREPNVPSETRDPIISSHQSAAPIATPDAPRRPAHGAATAGGGETRLVERCIDATARSAATVEAWRRQRRSLERLPGQLADALLRRLAARRLLFPSLLQVFQHSVEEIDLSGYIAVDAEWLAYLGSFRYLRVLKLADCKNVNNSAVWALSGMSTLKELDLSRCSKFSDAGIRHIVSVESLEKLHLSETGLSDNGVMLISSLENLHLLDRGNSYD